MNKCWLKRGDYNNTWNLIRSSLIGTWVGILPGIGGTTASIASYGVAKATSKNSDQFGNGASEGILAAETANSAAAVGSMVPVITLGIPGSVITAMLLGAMVIHDLNPGPLLFIQNPEVAHIIIAACLAANFIVLLVMWFSTPILAKLMYINKNYLLPPIVVFCFVGAYSVSGNIFDVVVMLGFSILGYILSKAKIPIGPFIIAFILTPLAEASLRSGLVVYGDSYLPLVTRPISLFFMVIAILTLVMVAVSTLKKSNLIKK